MSADLRPIRAAGLSGMIANRLVDEVLLARVQSEYPLASWSEIARAALYLATDPAPANLDTVTRLYSCSVKLRRMG
jgi:hypothetical protein